MPIIIRKIPHTDAYKVINRNTGRIHSYHTTFKKAQAQKRLLDAKDKKY